MNAQNAVPAPLPLISVVLSFYNEERNIPILTSRLRTVLRGEIEAGHIRGYELIYVNDNSRDRSLEVLLQELKSGNDIVIVNMSRNFGVWECVMAGMAQSRGDGVVYMDTDLQDPPELIPEMIRRWQDDEEVEVVYTTRLSRAGEHPFKLFVTKCAYRFLARTASIDLPLDSGDFKLLSRRAVEEVLRLKEKKPYLRGLISWIGFKQAQVFYHREPRADGRLNTKNPLASKTVLYNFLDSAMISFSDAPLKACLFVGFTLAVVSLAYIAVVVFQKIMGWYASGWPALMAAILLLGGVQLFMLGIVGLYIGKIFAETSGRPNYIVKDVIRPEDQSR